MSSRNVIIIQKVSFQKNTFRDKERDTFHGKKFLEVRKNLHLF